MSDKCIVFEHNRCGHCQSLAPEWKKAASALKVCIFFEEL